MRAKTKPLCAKCGLIKEASAFDHNEKGVRGVLCFGCNVSIGMFNHDVALLEAAATYVGGGGA